MLLHVRFRDSEDMPCSFSSLKTQAVRTAAKSSPERRFERRRAGGRTGPIGNTTTCAPQDFNPAPSHSVLRGGPTGWSLCCPRRERLLVDPVARHTVVSVISLHCNRQDVSDSQWHSQLGTWPSPSPMDSDQSVTLARSPRCVGVFRCSHSRPAILSFG